ncbi:Serine arginine-rich splicing factor 1 [Paramuricea clavata]|uniref:Serine arginine-rich splicing factor 1 n=1 Tax=Paramuricea clavata TaxID=317549 RepID=A0A6S7HTS7_PARCT|nr:Serine arginine-rich splicing factor 1 [Paramuricea clavata]
MSRERDSMFRGNNNDCRIYVGNLPEDCRERDVDDIFYKYGRIADIRIKRGDASRARSSRRGENLSYAFVQFEDSRDAEDAVRGRDGYEFDGRRVRVEFTRGSQNNRRDGGRSRGNSGGYGGGRSGRGVPPRRSNNRVLVKGLPSTGSWQDIKDHMREAGEVLYAEVYGDGSGIVEFAHSDDVKYAIKNLDDTEFRSHEYINCINTLINHISKFDLHSQH